MPKADANGISLEYDSLGADGAPPMLLIAGLGVQMTGWTAPFREALVAEGFRVIRFDNRDVGLSTHFADAAVPAVMDVAGAMARGERPEIPYSLRDMADDAVGLLDALRIERAHIVGRSMGGMIGQLVASLYPARAASLTCIMSSSGNPGLPPSTPEAMAVLTHRPPHPAVDIAGFLAHSLHAARVLGSPAYPFDEATRRAEILAAAERAYDPAGFGRQLAALVASGDRRALLRTVIAPTLVLHGGADPLIPVAAGADIAAIIPGAAFKVFEGMGHEIPPALFEEIVRTIVDFTKI